MDPSEAAYYAEMSRFELSELSMLLWANRLEQLAGLVTLISGYLVVAYLVAKKLTAFQWISVTLIYSVVALSMILGYLGLAIQAAALQVAQSGTSRYPVFVAISISFLLSWMLSIVFMIHSRRTEDQ